MPKYIVTVQQDIEVEARNKDSAIDLVESNIPWSSMQGTSSHGSFSIQTMDEVKIVEVRKI